MDAETVSPALFFPDFHSPYSEQSVYIANNNVIMIPKQNIITVWAMSAISKPLGSI
eukprot:CAMPEP_0184461556 /NCGR_PEP_ID=MMETSP0740-20130409/44953_1 /TAXON_ID=385413 /ORGANISM="Thalassiosira miniscula, Strain CCMP1093" /LENGTH=55 /DNA_ID=CAMNT_0026835221 /DNA_START=313 /DNA_END=480 /DNA_ORIENTATION=-